MTSVAPGSLRIGLFDAGMSGLHRVGLAGLWLTLRAVDQRPAIDALRSELATVGSWFREPIAVTFSWESDASAAKFFATLIKAAFQITDDGRVHFLGRGHPSVYRDQGVTQQDALLATFLQHGRTRGADPSGRPTGAVVVDTGSAEEPFQYRRITWYAHQRASFDHRAPNEIVGWQFPGGAVRHDAFKLDSQLMEPPGPWLALLFAPVGALYFRVRRRTSGIRPQFSLVLPEIDDLERYAVACDLLRDQAGVRDLVVNGSADAALRAIVTLGASNEARAYRVTRCAVTTFGIVPWSKQQKSRVDLFEADRIAPDGLRTYQRAHLLFPPMKIEPRQDAHQPGADEAADESVGQPRFETSPVTNLVASNVADGRPWWRGFGDLVSSRDALGQFLSYEAALRRAVASTELKGIAKMVNDTMNDQHDPAATIVRACHAAWRRRMGRLWEQAGQNQRAFGDLVSRERERLRVDFTRCKNSATLRATLTDFWARADGPIKPLQDDWRSVLPFLGEERWQEARDLALLALVSYAAPEEDAAGGGANDDIDE